MCIRDSDGAAPHAGPDRAGEDLQQLIAKVAEIAVRTTVTLDSLPFGRRPPCQGHCCPQDHPPTKVSSKVFVWFPTSEMMMLFAAEIGAVAGLMMGPYFGEPNRS